MEGLVIQKLPACLRRKVAGIGSFTLSSVNDGASVGSQVQCGPQLANLLRKSRSLGPCKPFALVGSSNEANQRYRCERLSDAKLNATGRDFCQIWCN
jgi:hypothetical protein